MQFLRTLFWVLITVVAVVFSIQNWKQVEISLSGIMIDIKLPLLLLITFLLGLVPMLILHRTSKWQLRRRVETAERALQQVTMASPPSSPPVSPVGEARRLPPGAVPGAVPPGGA